ncbi:hypothetical protein Z517_06833 [Fonsecaea pedrosoi CBS 271.37]|uniref:Aldehyde dehydrogenase n=1 Tax=Fonsecaea pedrosoi CBS 271.37 TaxID=1442368 RepID=A0A0D2GHE3_9EURO|nr:uncharacterized protein Z517_06833 [Fonsecaea pedrosoi CBS 271.37]KIW80218.1 hypothetical protein Z517_06833 [Fonsecaea pedrosoi CBS 271.37]
MATYSSVKEVDDAYSTLFSTFTTGRTKDHAWRRWQLKQVWWMLEDNEARIVEALKADLNRHPIEAVSAEVFTLKSDVLDHLKHLDEWTGTVPLDDAGFLMRHLGQARLRKEPLGVTLIIGAWNYPIQLLLQPMIAAIAAGCCIMLKPSELSVNSERLLKEMIPKYLDSSAIRLVTAGADQMPRLLEKRFNHVFFTGSNKVARFVAAAAAKHLTPVVLELGGQGPCIVTKSADVDFAAKRISYAKFTNAGQICLSVNHVFAEPEIVDQLLERLSYWNSQYLREGPGDMCRIVNERHFDRLSNLLDRSNGVVTYGGKHDKRTRFFHPTVVRDVVMGDSLMSDEIFGPITPVITCSVAEAIERTNKLPNPLALYLFSNDQAVIDETLAKTLSGGVTINNVFFHAVLHGAPFGGVGESGQGAYHGKYGVDCFSHSRAVVAPPSWMDRLMAFTFPPYNAKNLKYLTVKNSIGFRRGETMEDQRKRKSFRSAKVLSLGALTIVVFFVGRYILHQKKGLGGRFVSEYLSKSSA